jgi:hypothetical protein
MPDFVYASIGVIALVAVIAINVYTRNHPLTKEEEADYEREPGLW